MPIYEYQCSACGNAFEELVRNRTAAAPACPQCGEQKTDRLISTFAPGSSTAGEAGTSGGSDSGGNFPTCGRCGDFGPCTGGGA
ncbi:MAG: zinc ribbon domain-containing protein [Planctomycetes bacterium]|nr:zinc ribbon domain-containing protein [Planctomycetota bacterium]